MRVSDDDLLRLVSHVVQNISEAGDEYSEDDFKDVLEDFQTGDSDVDDTIQAAIAVVWVDWDTGGGTSGGGSSGGGGGFNCSGCPSPILLDVGADGFDLAGIGVGVAFDLDADGVPERIQWVRRGGDEVFLALDRNRNGRIDDGSELFGTATPLEGQGGDQDARHGFEALAQYDRRALGGNQDGVITRADGVWRKLLIWYDANANGRSEPGELARPVEYELVSLGISPTKRNVYDTAGNWLPLWDYAERSRSPTVIDMVDVFFRRLKEHRQRNDSTAPTPDN